MISLFFIPSDQVSKVSKSVSLEAWITLVVWQVIPQTLIQVIRPTNIEHIKVASAKIESQSINATF